MYETLGLEMRVGNVASAAGAGDKSATLQPSDGEMWIVVNAVGYNDEGDLSSRWTISDGVTTIRQLEDLTIGTGDRWSCYANYGNGSSFNYTPYKLPIVLDSKTSLIHTHFGLGAGKKCYIDYIVHVIRGVSQQ